MPSLKANVIPRLYIVRAASPKNPALVYMDMVEAESPQKAKMLSKFYGDSKLTILSADPAPAESESGVPHAE